MYLHSGDLALARRFYTDLLGLSESYFSAEDGTIGYQVGTLQISIATHGEAVPDEGWAKQMGWEGGTTASPSWGVELEARKFCRAVEATRRTGVPARHSEPQWVGYWSFPVKDPMGYTVEISTAEEDAWPG
ncbi:MAG: VOC family protein [Acidimicrobiia bacterium]